MMYNVSRSCCRWVDRQAGPFIPTFTDYKIAGHRAVARGRHYNIRDNERIYFKEPFQQPPRVLVWMKAFSFLERRGIGLEVSASNVRSDSFDLTINALGDNMTIWGGPGESLRSAGVTWIAIRQDKTDITMGHASFDNSGPLSISKQKNSGRASFDQTTKFNHPPKVLIALNKISLPILSRNHFEAFASNVTRDGFNWNLDAAPGTTIFSGGVSWIALASKRD
jgi:hypothetical protein